MTKLTAAIRIHHATAKKAAKAGVTLTVEGDRVVAVDPTVDPDREYSGVDAAQLLALVLAKRPSDDEGDDEEGEPEGDADDEEGEPEGDADAEGEEEEPEPGTIVKPKYKRAYAEFDDTCGDAFADALSTAGRKSEDGSLDLDACRQIAADNGLADRWVEWSAALNPGQRRMCLGNVLRGKVRRGEAVTIGKTTFTPARDAEGNLVKGEFDTSKPRGALR